MTSLNWKKWQRVSLLLGGGILSLGVLLETVAVCTHAWMIPTDAGTSAGFPDNEGTGIFKLCLEAWHCRRPHDSLPGQLKAVQIMACMSLIFSIVALAMALRHALRVLRWGLSDPEVIVNSVLFLSLLAGPLGLFSATVYRMEIVDELTLGPTAVRRLTTGYSFILCILGAMFVLIGGFMSVGGANKEKKPERDETIQSGYKTLQRLTSTISINVDAPQDTNRHQRHVSSEDLIKLRKDRARHLEKLKIPQGGWHRRRSPNNVMETHMGSGMSYESEDEVEMRSGKSLNRLNRNKRRSEPVLQPTLSETQLFRFSDHQVVGKLTRSNVEGVMMRRSLSERNFFENIIIEEEVEDDDVNTSLRGSLYEKLGALAENKAIHQQLAQRQHQEGEQHQQQQQQQQQRRRRSNDATIVKHQMQLQEEQQRRNLRSQESAEMGADGNVRHEVQGRSQTRHLTQDESYHQQHHQPPKQEQQHRREHQKQQQQQQQQQQHQQQIVQDKLISLSYGIRYEKSSQPKGSGQNHHHHDQQHLDQRKPQTNTTTTLTYTKDSHRNPQNQPNQGQGQAEDGVESNSKQPISELPKTLSLGVTEGSHQSPLGEFVASL